MESFSTYLKRHGLMLWLANLLGSMATSAIVATIGLSLFFIALLTGILTFASIDFSLNDSPEQILSKFLENATVSVFGLIGIVLSLFFMIGLSILATSFQVAAQYAVVDDMFKTDRVGLGNYFMKGFKYTFRMFFLSIMISLFYLPIAALVGVAIYIIVANSDLILIITGIGLIILTFIFSLLYGIGILHAPYILIAENMSVIRSITLSLRLLRTNFGQVLISCLLIWAVIIGYIAIGLLLYFPVFFSLFDPSGFLAFISSIGVNLIQMVYGYAGSPLMLALISLIVGYRYHKHLRHNILPDGGIDGHNQEPIFTFK